MQFSEQTDVITEAKDESSGATPTAASTANKSGHGRGKDLMLTIIVPNNLKTGDKFRHTTVSGENLVLRVPRGKKGGDTLLCLYRPPKSKSKAKRQTKRTKGKAKKRTPKKRQSGAQGAGSGNSSGGSGRSRPLRDPAMTWSPEQMEKDVGLGGPGGKITAVVVGHKQMIDPRVELPEPYTVYMVRVTTRDPNGTPLRSWDVPRRYQ